MRKKIVCWLIGHSIDPCDPWANRCFRCDREFDPAKPIRDDLGFWLTWFEIKRFFRLRRFLEWFRRCRYCKRRGAKCQCLPF